MKHKKTFVATDGNTAAARIAYKLNDMAIIYPITPSSPMAEYVDEMQALGEKNIFGKSVKIVQMQSEAGVAGALHGALSCGSLATTFTSSQGLLLMLPNMYKIAGELLPCVIHVASRTIATHALSIFGDHSDVMAARATGFAMLCSASVQEAQDFALAAHLATLESRIPIIHFFDGFRISHEINKIEQISDDTIKELIDYSSISAFKSSGLNPTTPTQRGTSQTPEVFFQNREAQNNFYNEFPQVLEDNLKKIYKKTGRNYKLFDYVGAKDATSVIISMGSSCETIEEVINSLCKDGEKVGLIKVRLFRPFSATHLLKALPKTVKIVTVLDRTKESGAIGDPLYLDICACLQNMPIKILAGRYGLSSKDFNPSMVFAIFKNMKLKIPKNHFTVGINDDKTHTSIDYSKKYYTNATNKEYKFWGLGSDGTVSANKNTVKIISENTPFYAQAYFEYDSKKAGSMTISHLRISTQKIHSTYLTQNLDLIACHNHSYLEKFDCLENIKKNGIFLLNCPWTDKEIEKNLPEHYKKTLSEKKIKFYVIDANKIADSVGLGGKINLIMQTAFFKLINIIPEKKAINLIKSFAKTTYSKKGEIILSKNMKAIDLAQYALRQIEVPKSWNISLKNETTSFTNNDFINEILLPIIQQKGNSLPVSAFNETGEIPIGTSQYEKRSITNIIPQWIKENCTQCNQCSLVCPHACIRPFLIKKGQDSNSIPSKIQPKYDFKIQVSPNDCTGCGNCANVCPAIKKALLMTNSKDYFNQQEKCWEKLKTHQNPIIETKNIVSTQFTKPLFEFSGACAGCGETAYIKLLTQLYGNKLVISNATGCSSIYGGSYPICPYTTNKNNNGPAWANSLFEDNAEFCYGMLLAHKSAQSQINHIAENNNFDSKLKSLLKKWQKGDHSEKLQEQIYNAACIQSNLAEASQLISISSDLIDKSFWAIGGDGWAYDIGFGGIDHVLSSGEKIRILVLDTEVYSNTGGQCSKSTPRGATAKFAMSGKNTAKKDMPSICKNYPNTYIATVSLGANMAQCQKAFEEAEQNDGPSIIFAYCPCQAHGIDMSNTTLIQRQAVTSGYFPLMRHYPNGEVKIDPPYSSNNISDFLNSEIRFKNLKKFNPEKASELFKNLKIDVNSRLKNFNNKE